MVLASVGLVVWLIGIHTFSWPQIVVPDLLIASLGYQSWLIYPYTFLHRVQVPRRKHRNQLNDGPIENIRSTERDAELLLVGRKVRQQQGPVIVARYLNDVA